MLTPTNARRLTRTGARYAIVASEYNAHYVEAMLRAARRELKRSRAAEVRVIRVPGAFEIPAVVARLARTDPAPAAILCLGVILRGETVHAEHIGKAVNYALMAIQVETGVPVIHEVLLLENEEQARARCLGARHNRGREAAQTAVAMAGVVSTLQTRATVRAPRRPK
jgi:6,7-dimethyl-8-ribityllumazine synthase